MTKKIARRPLPVRLLFAVPVLGWMLRDVAEGGEQEMMWFAVTVIALLAVATLVFGLPGLVAGMLVMAALVGTAIVLVTFG